jgi:[acyl-carrier-protein] S-malonyltransferase
MNNSIAFLFPGQGSQYVGMLKDLYETFPMAREIIQSADEILGFRLSTICFEGPADVLQQTENTQPAIYLHGYVLYKLLNEVGIRPGAAAGHSLGEYTSLVAARVLSFEDGLKLVRLRGELMQKAGEDQPGTMAAIIGLDEDTVVSICTIARQAGIVQPANFNAPGQIVISGSIEGVIEAMERAKSHGARLVKELVVSGAFHSPLMKSAQDELKVGLENTDIRDPMIPVYTNVTGTVVKTPHDIKKMLYEQIIAPVRWKVSMENMVADGFTRYLEVGPGKVLHGLLKRIDSSVRTDVVGTSSDIERISKSYVSSSRTKGEYGEATGTDC